MCEIERTLRRGASTPHTGYNKDKTEGHKLEIREILDALNVPSSLPDETLRAGEWANNLAPADPRHSLRGSGTSLTAFADLVWDIDCSMLLNSNAPACGRLIRGAFALHELPSLIESILLSKDECDTIRCLLRDDAQTFIDAIDKARPTLPHRRVSVDPNCHTLYQLGTRWTRPFSMGPKEMSQIVVQDVWPPGTSPESLDDPCLLRQNRRLMVQGRVCRRVEGGVLWSGRCCKGYKDILKQ